MPELTWDLGSEVRKLLPPSVTVEEIALHQGVEIERLQERIHSAVDEVQRRYAQMQREYDRLRHLMKEAYDRHKAEMREQGLATWTGINSYGQAAAASILAERDEALATVDLLKEQLEIAKGDSATVLMHAERWRIERNKARATADFRQGQLDYSRKRAEKAEAGLREAQRLLTLDNDETADLREWLENEQNQHRETLRDLREMEHLVNEKEEKLCAIKNLPWIRRGDNSQLGTEIRRIIFQVADGHIKDQDGSVPLTDED